MNRKKSIAILIFMAVTISGFVNMPIVNAATMYEIYASPTGNGDTCSFQSPGSLESVRKKVRLINGNMNGDIIVWLRGGVYTLDATFALTNEDSGTNGFSVIYKAYPGETPVFNGGQQITGWSLHDGSKNIYKAVVPFGSQFRQLYINGIRGVRARAPNLTDECTKAPYFSSPNPTGYPFTIDPSKINFSGDLAHVEMVWLSHWSQWRARISNIDSSNKIYFQQPESSQYFYDNLALNHHCQNPLYYYFENAYELVDVPGEWYHDRSANTVYYIPRAGEDIYSATVIAPKVETLINIEGTSSNQAKYIQLSGITFQYTNWTKPNTNGYITIQAALQLLTDQYNPLPGAVQIKNANNIIIEQCSFQHTGAHGLVTLAATHDNQIIGNTFSDLAAGGIVLNPTIIQGGSHHELIKNNIIEKAGQDYADAVGICATLVSDTQITHNEIRNLRYTGISFGWSWSDTDIGLRNNYVSYNNVHDVMKLLDDGAGIYTLGRMDNTKIYGNYIYNITPSAYNGGSPIAGIYLDNGSSYKTVENNVLNKTVNAFYAYNPPNHDNIFQSNCRNVPRGNIGSNYISDDDKIIGSYWPSAALSVINASGLEPLAWEQINVLSTSISYSSKWPGFRTRFIGINNDGKAYIVLNVYI